MKHQQIAEPSWAYRKQNETVFNTIALIFREKQSFKHQTFSLRKPVENHNIFTIHQGMTTHLTMRRGGHRHFSIYNILQEIFQSISRSDESNLSIYISCKIHINNRYNQQSYWLLVLGFSFTLSMSCTWKL